MVVAKGKVRVAAVKVKHNIAINVSEVVTLAFLEVHESLDL